MITPLWMSNNGRIACVKHGGAYLEAAIRGNPRKSTHVTPLDHWQRVTATERAEWIRFGHGVMKCEQCPEVAPPSSPASLTTEQRAARDKIVSRLHRAIGRLARAERREDAKEIASARGSVERATAARDAFLQPLTGHLWAPERIVYHCEARWSGATGTGTHRWVCEMVLDHKDLSGPQYRTITVLSDTGGPPTDPRNAPDSMGVAWFALPEYIANGQIKHAEEADAEIARHIGDVFVALPDGFLCERCARAEGLDLGDDAVQTWRVGSGGWLGPCVCKTCKRSIPVVVDGVEASS